MCATYISPVTAEMLGTIQSVLSISSFVQAFSNAIFSGLQMNFWMPRGAGRVTPETKALPMPGIVAGLGNVLLRNATP